jgi:hypothetical protein
VNFLDIFSKSTKISNFMKIRPVGVELFCAKDGQTDMTKLMVAFRNFCESSYKAIGINSNTSQACVPDPDGVRDVQNCVCGYA